MFPFEPRPCPRGVVLLLSVRSGDVARTSGLLRSGVRPDAKRDARGNTALHVAATHGHAEIARALVKAGACTEALTPGDHLTPLRLAAELGHLDTVKVLLDAGANVDAQDQLDRATPLHAAAEAGHTYVVRELAWRGAKLEARASSGQTPLRWALSLGQARTARALLQLGANPDAPDRLGACCLHAVAGLRPEDCGDFQPGAAETSRPPPTRSPFELAELLLSAGASVNRGRRQPRAAAPSPPEDGESNEGIGLSRMGETLIVGETPLHIAARESSVRVVKLLLENGSDPNAKTPAEEGGFSPLHSAASPGCGDCSRSVVRFLLEAGADVDAVAADGLTTPLRLACQNATVGCVEELLLWGAHDVSLAPPSSPRHLSSQKPQRPLATHAATPQPPAGRNHVDDALSSVGAYPGGGGGEGVEVTLSSSPASARGGPQSEPVPLVAVVGSRVPVSAKDDVEEEYIRRLLLKAPFDRAWRRRGWLVMLYATAARGRKEVSGGDVIASKSTRAAAGVVKEGRWWMAPGAPRAAFDSEFYRANGEEARDGGESGDGGGGGGGIYFVGLANPDPMNKPEFERVVSERKRVKVCRPRDSSCSLSSGASWSTNVFAGFTGSSKHAEPEADEDMRRLVRLLVDVQGDQAIFRSVVLWL